MSADCWTPRTQPRLSAVLEQDSFFAKNWQAMSIIYCLPRGTMARPTCVCCQCVSYSGLSQAVMGSFSFRFHALAVVLTYPRPLGRSQRLKQRPTPLLFTTTTPTLVHSHAPSSNPRPNPLYLLPAPPTVAPPTLLLVPLSTATTSSRRCLQIKLKERASPATSHQWQHRASALFLAPVPDDVSLPCTTEQAQAYACSALGNRLATHA
jgi:hypothetical protein